MPSTFGSTYICFNSLNTWNNLIRYCYYFSCFTDEETGTERLSNLPKVAQLVWYSVSMYTADSLGHPVHGRCSIDRGLFPFIKQDFTSAICCAVDNSGHFATFEKNNLFQVLSSSLGAAILVLKADFSWLELPVSQPRILGNALDPTPPLW